MGDNRLSPDTLMLDGRDLAALLEVVGLRGADFRFTARGGSMHPSIRSGDRVTVSPLSGTPPSKGEVAAFRHPDSGRLLVHRVFKTGGGGIQTRGDNLRIPDPPVAEESVLGVVTAVERNGRALPWPGRAGNPWTRYRLGLVLLRIDIRREIKRVLKFFLPAKSKN